MIPGIDNLAALRHKYEQVAPALAALYGRKTFKPHDGMDELVSCILSQSTTDANRDRGFAALKARYPTWAAVHHAPAAELIDTIRPAGLANSKGPRIQGALAQIVAERGAYNIDFLAELPPAAARDWLLRLPGVGPKTAAIVLCFAYGLPAFPVDTHVHRVGIRLGFLPPRISADAAHPVMEAIVPPADYYHFHLQMIYHGRALCQARRPQCERCPLTEACAFYQAARPHP
ncbi:MAG: endonuclease III [Anaerolineae bacterium]|jgi:endonuclease-3|nr:endonuclease III [Anaerolineae bacterium]